MIVSTVLAFLLAIGLLIVIHEYGHYRVARACGVKVLRFSIGFGRVLWRRQRSPDDTEFVVCALPLGGYVRMLDESQDTVAPSERGQAFNRKPLRQRAAIVAAGPAANLLLAVLLYAISHWIGIEEPRALIGSPIANSVAFDAGLRAGDEVSALSRDGENWTEVRSMTDLRWAATQAVLDDADLDLMVLGADRTRRSVQLRLSGLGGQDVDANLMQRIGIGAPYSEPVIGEVRPDGAADEAGLRTGDRVLSIDDVPMEDAAQVRERIRASGQAAAADAPRTGPMAWRISRDGQTLALSVQPKLVEDGDRRIGRVEAFIGPPAQMVTVRYGPIEGLGQAVTRTWEISVLTVRMIGRMLIGEASVRNLSGPLTIADYAGQTARMGAVYYISFLAMVSVSLGVLNLLPLPMLDGGHLMYYIFEGLTGRPVSEVWLKWLQRGGAFVLLLMMSLALSNDVARLLGLH